MVEISFARLRASMFTLNVERATSFSFVCWDFEAIVVGARQAVFVRS